MILHRGQASHARTPADKGWEQQPGRGSHSGRPLAPLGRRGRSSGTPLGTRLPGQHGHWILRPLQGPINQQWWPKHRGVEGWPPTGWGWGRSQAVLSPSTSEGLGTLCPAGCPTGCPAQTPPSLHHKHAWLGAQVQETDTALSSWTSQLK